MLSCHLVGLERGYRYPVANHQPVTRKIQLSVTSLKNANWVRHDLPIEMGLISLVVVVRNISGFCLGDWTLLVIRLTKHAPGQLVKQQTSAVILHEVEE